MQWEKAVYRLSLGAVAFLVGRAQVLAVKEGAHS